jgi:hypothetical protein
MDEISPFTVVGVLLILMGVILVALPYVERVIPNIEKVPWIILWVYRSEGFTFATSPLLIILSLISILLAYLRGR